MRQILRRRLAKLALFVGACVLSLALLEGLLTAFAWFKYRAIDVGELERIQTGNVDAAAFNPEGDGATSNFYPHPYLTFVRNRRGPQEQTRVPLYKRVNNIGLSGRDFPLRKDPAKFTILLTGGSVARQFGTAGEVAQSYLEQILNERYQFDRPVVVLNGANSAWKEPQAAIMCLLYGEVADAVVTLDGFNEHYGFAGPARRLELPAGRFEDLNPVARHGFGPLAAAWQAQELKRFSQQHRWRTVYFATRAMRTWLEKSAEAPTPGISAETIFSLPTDWSKDERFDFNLAQYRKYMRSIDKLATLHGARRAFFIQPCPAIDKTLTPEELRFIRKLDYGETYRQMADGLLALRDEGFPIRDLGGVFASTPETIYCDHIHCAFSPVDERTKDADFRPSPGYKIMADAIADHLAELWEVEKK